MGRKIGVVALTLLLAGGAHAAPPGVTERDGMWIAPDGKALYTFARDADGASNCNGACASAWPPLMAESAVGADTDWRVIDRSDGTQMWAYKGRPLYTHDRDRAGGPATGASAAWPVARK